MSQYQSILQNNQSDEDIRKIIIKRQSPTTKQFQNLWNKIEARCPKYQNILYMPKFIKTEDEAIQRLKKLNREDQVCERMDRTALMRQRSITRNTFIKRHNDNIELEKLCKIAPYGKNKVGPSGSVTRIPVDNTLPMDETQKTFPLKYTEHTHPRSLSPKLLKPKNKMYCTHRQNEGSLNQSQYKDLLIATTTTDNFIKLNDDIQYSLQDNSTRINRLITKMFDKSASKHSASTEPEKKNMTFHANRSPNNLQYNTLNRTTYTKSINTTHNMSRNVNGYIINDKNSPNASSKQTDQIRSLTDEGAVMDELHNWELNQALEENFQQKGFPNFQMNEHSINCDGQGFKKIKDRKKQPNYPHI